MRKVLALLFALLAAPAAAQTIPSGAWGSLNYWGVGGLSQVLAPGLAGQCLQTQGVGSAPIWTTCFTLPPQNANTILANVTTNFVAPQAVDINRVLDTVGYDIARPPAVQSILYKSNVGPLFNWQALPPGVSGMVLTSGGPVNPPFWATQTQASLVSICSTVGAILYFDTPSLLWKCLAPGTAGQTLQTGGAGANPSWLTRNLNTSAPLGGGGALTTDLTLTCTTCATTTNGGALSATAPVVLSAAGNISLNNQGTTTTVLHGNAAGAPSYAAVNLSTDASGTLQAAQFPALTGDVTSIAGALGTTIAANAVTNAKAAQMAAYTVKGNATGAIANAQDLVSPILTSMQLGYTGVANGTRLDARDSTTLSNNTAVYIEAQRNVSSVVHDNVTTVNNVSATGVDSGTGRFIMRNLGTANGYVASTKGAFVRALEAHSLVDSSIPNDANRTTWIMELGLHSQLAGDNISKNSGIYLASSHTGWLPTGLRNDTALLITGEDGWVNAIRYLDTNGTTILFNVDQTGTITSAAANIGNLVSTNLFEYRGTATPAALTVNVNDYVLSFATVQRISATAAVNITGISGSDPGLVHKLVNIGTFPITLTNEDVLSLAANRFHIGAGYVLRPGMALDLWYDATLARWVANIGGQLGTPLADNAPAGTIGEYVETVVPAGAPVPLTNATATTVAQITLAAGDWDVDANLGFIPAATTSVTALYASVSTTTNSLDTTNGRSGGAPMAAVVSGGSNFFASVEPVRFSLAASTTLFAVGYGAFTASTLTSYGFIRARRVR